MSDWKTYKLGDLIEKITKGTTPSTLGGGFVEHGINFIKSESVGYDGRIDKSTFAYITEETYEKLKRSQLQEGDILFSMAGIFLGKNAIVTKDILPANTNQALAIIRLKNEITTPKFVHYFLRQNDVIKKVNSMSGQSAQPNINFEEIKSIEINIPDEPTQTAIAQILTSLDDKIELNLQMNQTLEAMAQAIFKEWFVDFKFPGFDGELENGLPKGWRMGIFEELMEFTNGYAFKSTDLLDNYEDECYYVFKMGNIKKGGGLKYDGTKSFYKKENALNLKKYILKRGDLLMCMTDMKDNVALLGHTALMNEDDKFIVNQRVGLLRSKNDISIDYPYLYILTNFPEFIVELRSRANRGVQVNLSTSEIKNIQVIIPPKDINALFDSTLKPIFNKIFSNIEQIQSLTQTRDTLLPKLMSGKIEIKK